MGGAAWSNSFSEPDKRSERLRLSAAVAFGGNTTGVFAFPWLGRRVHCGLERSKEPPLRL